MKPVFEAMNNGVVEGVQDYAMSESTFPIEFIGGSRDGENTEATAAPEHFEVLVDGGFKEIYERQNSEPPFFYVQIGYAPNETWK
jgi:hypothetical protein